MPCVLAASPSGALSLTNLTAPVLLSMRPTGEAVGYIGREPEIAVEIGNGVVHERAAARRRAERPVAAVGGGVLGRHAEIRRDRYVVFLEHHPRGLARGARPQLDRHIFGRATRPREIGRELLLMAVQHALGLVVRTAIYAGHVHTLHQIDDRRPPSLVEPVLKRKARRVAARAIVGDQRFHPPVFGGGVGQ